MCCPYNLGRCTTAKEAINIFINQQGKSNTVAQENINSTVIASNAITAINALPLYDSTTAAVQNPPTSFYPNTLNEIITANKHEPEKYNAMPRAYRNTVVLENNSIIVWIYRV